MRKQFAVVVLIAAVFLGLAESSIAQEPKIYVAPKLSSGYSFDVQDEKKLLEKFSAETREYLEEIKKYDEHRYRMLLHSGRVFSASLVSLFDSKDQKKADKATKIHELGIQTTALGLRYQNTSGSKEKIKAELLDKLSKLFELKEQEKIEEVKALEKELAELREALEFRQRNKNEIIRKRMYELLGSDYYEW